MEHRATYSPDDNKLRLYPASRLPREDYDRMKAAGFKWAPQQEIFVAPMWTPEREDLLLDLAGEIGDEDTSLTDRAEARAERFEGYSENRAEDAQHARQAVAAIADHIPMGQPILVGHHSERRARKDAERIENGMRRAVKMWETSEYWARRAKGALLHAKHKERPDVRARRIKGLEADKRKQERNKAEAEKWLAAWSKEGLTHDEAIAIADYCRLNLPRKEGDRPDFDGHPSAYTALTNASPTLYAPRTLAEVVDHAKRVYPVYIAHTARWIAHYENRLSYERAMLSDGGGLAADRFEIEVGGRVQVGGEWLTVLRINKTGGRVASLSTNRRYVPVVGIEEVKDYQPPAEGIAEAVKAAAKLPPLCNYPGEGFYSMTKAEYDRVPKDYKGTHTIKATDAAGAHRVRTCLGVYCMPKEADFNKRHSYPNIYITDAKERRPDPVQAQAGAGPAVPAPERIAPLTPQPKPAAQTDTAAEPGQAFQALREILAQGVQVVAAPQLFPTPPELATRMVELAHIEPGQCVLEPSAGTGAIVQAVADRVDTEILCYEINPDLCAGLRRRFPSYRAHVERADFLEVESFMGQYPRVLMNPPFSHGEDIRHIQHARKFLAPGGRLVALCANGPRQREALQPLAAYWEDLPPGTFAESGTQVNAALLVIEN